MNFSGEIELERVATKSEPFGYAELVLGNKAEKQLPLRLHHIKDS